METIEHFRARVTFPTDLEPALQALWWAQAGEWSQAHVCVQEHEGDPSCDLVHAHLHRREGDLNNAKSWYDDAGRPVPAMSVQDEWTALAIEFLARA